MEWFMKKWKLLVKAYNTYNTSQELGAAHFPGYLQLPQLFTRTWSEITILANIKVDPLN